MQRIGAGRLRGRRLLALPDGVRGLRPMASRIREAVFDRLGPPQGPVLDLFAGSGALGIEALSRGAPSAVFVDEAPRVARHLRAQLAALGLQACTRVMRVDALTFLKRTAPEPFDLVFLDPPFATPDVFAPVCRALVSGWLAPGARVVCERERVRGKSAPVDWPDRLALEGSRVYGQAVVEFLRETSA